MTKMPDQRNRSKFGPFSTWQWSVIGSYVIAIVLSAYVGSLARSADAAARNANAAICVEVGFLENSRKTTEELMRHAPKPDPVTDQIRRDSLTRLDALVASLRETVPSCKKVLE